MSIIETDTIKHTRDLIAETVSNSIDALPFDGIEFPDVSDVSDTITHAAATAAATGGKGAVKAYRVVSRTVRTHPLGSGLTLVAVLAFVGAFVWWNRRSSAEETNSLQVARAA